MRKIILALGVAASLVLTAPVSFAQTSAGSGGEAPALSEVSLAPASSTPSGSSASDGMVVVDKGEGLPMADRKVESVSAHEVLSLIVNEGQILRLPKAATSVFVANPKIADVQVKSGALLYLYGREVGRTSFYAVDRNDQVVASRTIVVGFDLAGLRRAIRQVTGEDSVTVAQVEDMILLGGSVDNATVGQDIVKTAMRYLPESKQSKDGSDPNAGSNSSILNRMSYSGSNQVNIRVRVAEVRRDAIKTLGIGTSIRNPRLFGDLNASVGFDTGISLVASAAGGGGLSTTIGATSLSTALDALVQDGMATILAEPNLTAVSGETANFLAGGEIPLAYANTTNGITTVTVEYKEYGVKLAFTPTVISGNRVNLRVAPEVSERDDSNAVLVGGGAIPAFRTRKAQTSVELGSGQSFAIAGLIQNNSTQNMSKFPGLGDLPVLGQLFRSEQFRQNQSELVIIVTPYLVKPTQATALLSPTDGFVPPNDVDRYMDGRFNSVEPTPAPVATALRTSSPAEGGLRGQVGYVLQ